MRSIKRPRPHPHSMAEVMGAAQRVAAVTAALGSEEWKDRSKALSQLRVRRRTLVASRPTH